MRWLVAVVCYDPEILSNPTKFLSDVKSRVNPRWRVGVLDAANEDEAFERGLVAFRNVELEDQHADEWFVNFYVAPLRDDSSGAIAPAVSNAALDMSDGGQHCECQRHANVGIG